MHSNQTDRTTDRPRPANDSRKMRDRANWWAAELERQRRDVGAAWDELIGAEPEKLVAMANERAIDQGLTRSLNDQRNVINMLRHDYSHYDTWVTRSKSDRLYGEVLDAIARDFPWLADQCAKDKATHYDRLPPYAKARRGAHEDAQDRQRIARDVVKRLSIGDKVMVSWRGPREAEIIEIRRTRVRAAFTLPDGSRYVIDRSADQVSRADDDA
jgi:hypothetical protein